MFGTGIQVIMMVAAAVLILLTLGYAFLIGRFALGFRRVRPVRHRSPEPPLPFVSVVVPARDEAAVIGGCVEAILANDYPRDRFEVIVADDLSTDDTPEVVQRFQARFNRESVHALPDGAQEEAMERLRLIRMEENLDEVRAHKKRAIEKAVATARGEIILTTDADCLVQESWIRTMIAFFTPETAFVSGAVLYRTNRSFFEEVQALDFLGLVAVGAGAIGSGRPNLCNGANAAYRRDVFQDLGGYAGLDHLTSGDDELLMQRIAYDTDWQVRFCADRRAVVTTRPSPTLRAFIEQRRRWASKGAHYPHTHLVAQNALVYFFYLILLADLVAALFVPGLWMPVLAAFGLKMIVEAFLIAPACRHFRRMRLLRYFFPAQLLQLPYIVILGAVGALGGYEWKGRRIER